MLLRKGISGQKRHAGSHFRVDREEQHLLVVRRLDQLRHLAQETAQDLGPPGHAQARIERNRDAPDRRQPPREHHLRSSVQLRVRRTFVADPLPDPREKRFELGAPVDPRGNEPRPRRERDSCERAVTAGLPPGKHCPRSLCNLRGVEPAVGAIIQRRHMQLGSCERSAHHFVVRPFFLRTVLSVPIALTSTVRLSSLGVALRLGTRPSPAARQVAVIAVALGTVGASALLARAVGRTLSVTLCIVLASAGLAFVLAAALTEIILVSARSLGVVLGGAASFRLGTRSLCLSIRRGGLDRFRHRTDDGSQDFLGAHLTLLEREDNLVRIELGAHLVDHRSKILGHRSAVLVEKGARVAFDRRHGVNSDPIVDDVEDGVRHAHELSFRESPTAADEPVP